MWVSKRPSKPNLPAIPKPLISYSNKTSRNRVLSSFPDSAIHPIAFAKVWLLPILPNNSKSSLDTLKGYGKCLGYQPLKGMEMER